MNTAFKETYSTFLENEIAKTFPREDFSEASIEISPQRINSFFKEPLKTEQEGEFNRNEDYPNILYFPLKDKEPIALAPRIRNRQRTFTSSQKWEGYVIELYKDSFLARITDLSGKYPDEELEIELKAISPDDRSLLQTGAVFNWHIGYETEHGTTKRSSIIRFRRLPIWTESDIEKAKALEEELKNFLTF